MSNILFYSDTNCRTQISGSGVTGASDGTCTQFGISNFGSFAVRSLGTNCVVTVYGNDVAYCSSSRLQIVALGACVSNSTINQFSVDGCRDTSAPAPAVSSQSSSSQIPSTGTASVNVSGSGTANTARTSLSASATTATGANGSVSVLTVSVTAIATAPASSSSQTDSAASEGLSTGAKAGMGVGIALLVIALIALTAFFVLRHKKKQRTPPVPSEEKEIGSHTGAVAGIAPAYSFRNEKGGVVGAPVPGRHELSPEGRPLAELSQGWNAPRLVEAPGDHSWAMHEMGGGTERSELTGSTPNLHEKHT